MIFEDYFHKASLRCAIGSDLLYWFALSIIVSIVFLPGLPGQFLFDDIPNIVNNSIIHLDALTPTAVAELLSTRQDSGYGRILPTLSFALDYWRAGGVADPATFKTTNLLIHALTALALVGFFRRLLRAANLPAEPARWAALALALAWAAHPLQVSSVLYAVQRLQTLGTLFLVLALTAYLDGRLAQIRGSSGKIGLLAALLLWVVAMGCKEDSTLFPAYALALELTVLRFAAADALLAHRLERGFLAAVLAGLAVYLLWVIPHYWQWEAYPGRDFNSAERLLTQPRVLCLYLWQILVPLPGHMPFHYDWLAPSRGLLQPWTTLPALLLVVSLLALGWRQRHRRPLLALGIFLFFGAHFIASNVIGLELAFEHRNHFALIGAVLAVGSLLAQAAARGSVRPAALAGVCAAALVALACATALRAHDWRDAVSLAKASAAAAPDSPRAWIELCDAQVQAGGGATPGNPLLDSAIRACASGAEVAPQSLNNLALLVVLKTVRGEVSERDWAAFLDRLETVPMSWDNTRAPLILAHYAGLGVKLDKAHVLAAMAALDRRATLKPGALVTIGDSIMDDFNEPDLALPYYVKALESVPPGDSFAWELADRLRARGRGDLIVAVAQAARVPKSALAPSPSDP